jgi:transposase-like protein
MEEGRLKSKRLSYTAKFKREVIRCIEENGNHKAAAIFGVDESNVRLWRKHKAAMTLYRRTMLKIKMIVTGWRARITIQL